MKDFYKILQSLILFGIVIIIEIGEILFLLYGDKFFEHLGDVAKFGTFLVTISNAADHLVVGWILNFLSAFIVLAVLVSDNIFQWIKRMFEAILSTVINPAAGNEKVRETSFQKQVLIVLLSVIGCYLMLGIIIKK